jgi:hypothetical protein
MIKSLQVEPRNGSFYEPHFFRRTSEPSAQTLLPLIFPQPLPTCSLIDRTQLLKGGPRLHWGSDWGSAQHEAQLISDEQVKNLVALKKHRQSGRSLPHHLRMTSAAAAGGHPQATLPDTVVHLRDGELQLIVLSHVGQNSPSRPTSMASTRPQSMASEAETSGVTRAPSVRVKPRNGTASVERKASLAKRSSLPSLSQNPPQEIMEHVVTNDAPLKAIVKAGTLDSLIDILVSGVEDMTISFADDHGEAPLNMQFRSRLVRVDRPDFEATWWSVFRSFVTPVVFFEVSSFFRVHQS